MRSLAPGRLLALALGLLTCVLSVLVPLAPVVVSTPTVTWPQAGAPATSTTALFMPYRPLDVRADVPCATLAALPDGGTALATSPEGSDRGAQRSLAVTVSDGQVAVRSSGRDVLSVAVDDPRFTPGCVLTVLADQAGTSVGVGAVRLADVPGLPVPEVDAFVTDAPAAGPGPGVVAHPDARFESRPAAVKTAVLAAHGLLALASLAVLLLLAGPAPRARRRSTTGLTRPNPARLETAGPRWWRRTAVVVADVVVAGVLLVWAGIGPLHTDDFYYVLEARSSAAMGYVGNAVRYFNVPEIPFTLQQTVLAAVAQVSVQPFAMRLPAAVCGIGTWWLLTRLVLPRLVERPPVWSRPLAAAALLAWWLPFDVSARPESLVVLLTTAVLALTLEAVGRRRVWLLGAAAALAGTAVAVTASGLLGVAVLVVLAPRWWPLLRESRVGVPGGTALLLACASVASPLVFADATLAGALTSLRVHDEVGPNLAWWEEPLRYWYLTQGPDPNQRLYSRQVVVLVTLVLLVGVTASLLRARRPLPGPTSGPTSGTARTAWAVPAAVTTAGLAVLAISPTKWSHHFGALAGVGTLLAVVACVLLVRRRPSRWPVVALWVGLAVAAGAALHGPDAQVEYSAYAVTPELPEWLGQPLLWLALPALLTVGFALRRRRRADADVRDAWPELAVTTLGVVLVASLVVQGLSVATATWRLRGSWSVASDAVRSLSGTSCGFADAAVALTGQQALAASPLSGEGSPAEPLPAAEPSVAEDVPALPDTVPAGAEAYAVTRTETVTPYRSLDDRSAAQTLAFDVLGDAADLRVTVEFRTGDGAVVPVPAVVPGGEGWRRVGFGPLADVPPGAVEVRVRAVATGAVEVDGDDAPVVGVTDPYRRTAQTLTDVLPRDGAVLVDWPIGLHLPCATPPRVAGGMVEPVRWFVRSATFESAPALTFIDGGGSYATLPEVATLTPYRGFLPGAPYREWGDLVRVDYPLPPGAYDVTPGTRTVPGWRWWAGAGPGPSPQAFVEQRFVEQ